MNGLKTLETPSTTGGSNMVIRETIYAGFTTSREYSVFSCETHLTSLCFLSRRNSQEWWKVRGARIRISTSLDTAQSYPEPDLPIGATLTLLRNSNPSQWCDICKQRYGSHRGEWNLKAQKPAYWKCVSQSPLRKNQVRFYCLDCANDIQNWPDGTFYSLKEQLLDGLRGATERLNLDVELPR